ncbi:cytochrome C assembly family protein [Marinospirillum perlucidum]|uniref:cytochrome C assembly family protein n=1 Tax=Marinospirillum perlucidum TaxID=1982602 RepID=UPI000DF22329|nr:cytochrome c biogenesis protein CcsA [Marinospirillum perlucidum]
MAAFLPFTLLAIAFYLAGASWVGMRLLGRAPENNRLVRVLGLVALINHAIVLYSQLDLATGLSLGLLDVASLLSWLICAFILLASLRHPTLNLAVALFPLAGVLLLLGQLPEEHYQLPAGKEGLLFHVLASLSAYSLFALASVQAVLLALQNRQLKHHHLKGLISVLPPLQTMERLLFDLLIAGQVLLTLGILSGFIFLDQLFTGGNAHKTFFSLAAWLTFGILLVGRWRLGWRGIIAVRWTLGGSLLLLLAYFGSKLVLQFLTG